MTTGNLVKGTQLKLVNERVLGTDKPSSCKYVILVQSLQRGKLFINWYIAQEF